MEKHVLVPISELRNLTNICKNIRLSNKNRNSEFDDNLLKMHEFINKPRKEIECNF